jgi:membrane protein DedA with SNARE-associated domain
MAAPTLTHFCLTTVTTWGAPALGLGLLLGTLGVPVPSERLMLAAGTLTRQGGLDWRLAFVPTLAGAVLGDSTG